MHTSEYVNALKNKYNLTSEYAVAKLVGVKPQTALYWKNKGTTFDDKTAVKVAELLDVRPEVVLIDMERERTKCPQAKAALSRVARLLEASATICFCFFLWTGPAPTAQANYLPDNIHYTQYSQLPVTPYYFHIFLHLPPFVSILTAIAIYISLPIRRKRTFLRFGH
jgi:hypothetical protein